MTSSVTISNPHSDKTIRIARRNPTTGGTESTRHMPGPTVDWVEHVWAGGTYLVISEHNDYGEVGYNESYNGLQFGLAVEALKKGLKVRRAGWNGKGMWLALINGKDVQIHNHEFGPKNEFDHNWKERVPDFAPWIGMKTADNKFVPWLASQTDILSEDWQVV